MRLLLKISGSGLIGETHPANQNQSWRWTRSLGWIFARTGLHQNSHATCSDPWALGACPSCKLKSVPELKRHKLHHFTSQVKAGNDRKHLYFMGKTMEKPCPVKHIIQSSTQSGHQKWPTGKSSVLVWLILPCIYVHINMYIYICIYVYVHKLCIYICIYIERERKRDVYLVWGFPS